MEPTAQTLPQNINAERALLGAVIKNNKALDAVGMLTEEDFFSLQHARIFRTMRGMAGKNEPIDLVSLVEAIKADGDIELVGGVAYVAKLADGVATVSNVTHYTKLVLEKARLRKILHIAKKAQDAVLTGGEADSVLDAHIQACLDLAANTNGDVAGKTKFESAASLLNNLKTHKRRPVLTGLEKLDQSTGGFFGGELVTLTASTGVGKTLLAQQIQRFACGTGLHCMYCSGEMTAEHLISRELATEACIEHWKMRRPEKLDIEQIHALEFAAAKECKKCITLDGELSLANIRVAARRKKQASGLDLVILDYDELIDAPGQNELEQQRELVRGSKRLGIELDIPVIMISQLRKSPDAKDAKRPTIEKIYGSGAKSKHSSWIIYVDREWVRDLTCKNAPCPVFPMPFIVR